MGKQRERDGRRNDGVRHEQIQELIREEVNFLLRNEIRDPRLQGVEVTMVELAGDGSCARLWFTAPDNHDNHDNQDRSAACARVIGFLRAQLAENLGLKRTPDLRWKRDPTTQAETF